MAMLADVQEFQYTCQKITSVFYKQCFSLDNHKLLDTIAEAITSILFTACGGMVHYLVRALFTAQHQDAVTDLDRIMYEYTNIFRLADMKMCYV